MFDSYLPASALNLRTPPAKVYVVTREVPQEPKPVMVGLTLSKFTAKRRGQKFREIDVIRFKGENWVKLDDSSRRWRCNREPNNPRMAAKDGKGNGGASMSRRDPDDHWQDAMNNLWDDEDLDPAIGRGDIPSDWIYGESEAQP